MISIKRAYEKADTKDGYRILIDRLWPRGIAKSELQLDAWEKDIAPSTKLRQWYKHDPKRWAEFTQRYKKELQDHKDALKELKQSAKNITLVYGTKDIKHTHALVLKEVLDSL